MMNSNFSVMDYPPPFIQEIKRGGYHLTNRPTDLELMSWTTALAPLGVNRYTRGLRKDQLQDLVSIPIILQAYFINNQAEFHHDIKNISFWQYRFMVNKLRNYSEIFGSEPMGQHLRISVPKTLKYASTAQSVSMNHAKLVAQDWNNRNGNPDELTILKAELLAKYK